MNSENNLIFERYARSLSEATYGTGSMSVEQLKDFLFGIKGTVTGVTVDVESQVKMNKKNRITGAPNPYTGTIKKSTIKGTAGGDHEIAVMNRELDAHQSNPDHQPQFEGESLWHGKGKRVSSILAQHVDTGEYYLVIGNVSEGKGEYFHNGAPVTAAELAPYRNVPPAINAKQAAVGISQENQVTVRYPKLNNIKRIDIKGYDITVQ